MTTTTTTSEGMCATPVPMHTVWSGYNGCNGHGYNGNGYTHEKIYELVTSLQSQLTADSISLHNRMCGNEKEILKMGYESRLETKQATHETADKISLEGEKVRDQLVHFERSVDNKFCEVNANIAKLREQALEIKNQDLRDALQECRICACATKKGND